MEAQEYWDKKLDNLAPATQIEYRRHFGNFLTWASLTPEELYHKTKQVLDAKDPRDADEIQDLAKKYTAHMDAEGKAPSTINQFVKSLVSFMRANKLEFDAEDIWVEKSYRGSKKISKEQILEIYRYCQRAHKLRNRALVLFLKDSGLRVSDAVKMNVGDYNTTEKFMYEGQTFAWFNPQRTKKTKSDAYPCIGEESITAVSDYLDERGEPDDDEPLFLDDEGKRMTRSSASVQFSRLRKTLKNPQKISAHSCRKFHTTALMSEGMEQPFVHCLQGKTRSVYVTPYDDNTLREAYAQAYHALRIFPHTDIDRELHQVHQNNQELRRRINQRDTHLDSINTAVMEIQEKMTLYAPLIDDLIQANKNGVQLKNLDKRLKELQVTPVEE